MQSQYQSLDDYINRYEKFIISTHESPDWDGLGAEIAFNELLKKLGKATIILNSDPTPDSIRKLDPDGEINVLDESFEIPEDITDYAQIVLDTNDYDNIGAAYNHLRDKVQDLFIIDHHEGAIDKIDTNFIKADASSVCEIVYDIFFHYTIDMSLKSAQALFAGIVFDTGSFRYAKTSPETFRIGADLVEKGVVPFEVYEMIYEQNSLSSFELRGLILATMEVFYDGSMIAMKLTREMLEKTGASFSEGEPAINLPLMVKGVVASLLVKQDIDGPVKVSMRTKGDYDVAEIAMAQGGGGHKNAAGYKSKHSFDDTYTMAVKTFDKFFKKNQEE